MVSIYFCIVSLFVLHQTFFVTGETDCIPQFNAFHSCRRIHHDNIVANLTRDFGYEVFLSRLKSCCPDFVIIPYENSTVQRSADRDNLWKRRNCTRDHFISQRSTLQANFQARGLNFTQLLNAEEPFTDFGQHCYKYPILALNYYSNLTAGKCNWTCIRLTLNAFNEGSNRNIVGRAGNSYCNARQKECYKFLTSNVCRTTFNKFMTNYSSCAPNVTSTECGFNKSLALRKAYEKDYSCGVIPPNPADQSTSEPVVQVAAATATTKAAVAANIAASQQESSNTGVASTSTANGTKTNTSSTGTATTSSSGSGGSTQATTQKSNVSGSATTSNPSGSAAGSNQGATTIKASQGTGSDGSSTTIKSIGDTSTTTTVKAGVTVGTNVSQGQTGSYPSITTVKAGGGDLASTTTKPNSQTAIQNVTQGQNTQYSTAKPSGGDVTTVKVNSTQQITTPRFGDATTTKNSMSGVTNGSAYNSAYSTPSAVNTGQQTTAGYAAATTTKNVQLGSTSTGSYGNLMNTTPKLSQGNSTGYPSVTNGTQSYFNITTTKPSATTQKAG